MVELFCFWLGGAGEGVLGRWLVRFSFGFEGFITLSVMNFWLYQNLLILLSDF